MPTALATDVLLLLQLLLLHSLLSGKNRMLSLRRIVTDVNGYTSSRDSDTTGWTTLPLNLNQMHLQPSDFKAPRLIFHGEIIAALKRITCSTVVLQCYRRQAIPMEQAKIRHIGNLARRSEI